MFGVIVMIALAVPVVTGWLETRDEGRREINRMADCDRRRHSTQRPNRRLRYAKIEKPRLCGRTAQGRRKKYMINIPQTGGAVNG